MANKRTYWAIQGLGTAAHGTGPSITEYDYAPGIQSVGMSTNFNLEQIFQLGQLEIYQDLEEVPDIELTIERAMDEHALFYVRAVGHAEVGGGTPYDAGIKTLTGTQNNRADVYFAVYSDGFENAGDVEPDAACYMSGMFCSSASFNFGTDGFFTESVSLVGESQIWNAPGVGETFDGAPTSVDLHTGAVSKRQHFRFFDATQVPEPLATLDADLDDFKIPSISVSVDFGREQMFSLGQRQAYHRYVTFPIEVTCDIEAYVTDVADMAVKVHAEDDNTSEQKIKFIVAAGPVDNLHAGGAVIHTFDLGEKNRLSSITWNGISTDGTNATITYSYRNFNKLDVTTAATTNDNG